MKKGNILVIGNSGAGKSTLINAVLGENAARTGFGIEGVTLEPQCYTNDSIPFRLIDTIGFEPNFWRRQKSIRAVQNWSRKAVKGREDKQVNVIWFCVDGTANRLFPESIRYLTRAISIWESVPIVVVITKSYSIPDRMQNRNMVHSAFIQQRRCLQNLRAIVPVVAKTFVLNDTAYAPPEGITELIEITNSLMPEGIRAAEQDVNAYKLSRKRALAQGMVGASAAAAAALGAAPIPVADATALTALEFAEVTGLARIYGIKSDDKSKAFFDTILTAGTVSAVARGALSTLKAIPGVNLGAGVLNALIAASFAAAIGEVCIYAFEQIHLGNKTVEDLSWASELMEKALSGGFVEKVTGLSGSLSRNMDPAAIARAVLALFLSPEKDSPTQEEDKKDS